MNDTPAPDPANDIGVEPVGGFTRSEIVFALAAAVAIVCAIVLARILILDAPHCSNPYTIETQTWKLSDDGRIVSVVAPDYEKGCP